MTQKHRHHKGVPNRKRSLLLGALALLLVAIVATVLYFVGRDMEKRAGTSGETRGDLTGRYEEPRTVTYNGQTYRYRADLLNVLIMGIDRTEEQMKDISGFRNGGQSDFLLLLIIDPKTQTITPLQIDRDTMAEITILGVLGNDAGTRTAQLCLSHGFGDGKEQSAGYTVSAVSKHLLGVDIDFYLALDLTSIALLNDALGGVTVTLADDFSMLDPAMTTGTTLTLQGKQAEYYVRNRLGIGVGTNESRMVRQRDYMTQVGIIFDEKLHEESDFTGKLFDLISTTVTTNMSRGRLINEVYASRNYQRLDTISPAGKHIAGEGGFIEFHHDQEALEQLVLQHFFERVDAPDPNR